jgi:hypothetical protein
VEVGGIWKPHGEGENLALKGGQSLTGRLWDLLWMLRLACDRARDNTDRIYFQVLVDVHGKGRREVVKLCAVCGPGDSAQSVITILLEGETNATRPFAPLLPCFQSCRSVP